MVSLIFLKDVGCQQRSNAVCNFARTFSKTDDAHFVSIFFMVLTWSHAADCRVDELQMVSQASNIILLTSHHCMSNIVVKKTVGTSFSTKENAKKLFWP
jgi:hypothetical protein